MFPEACNVLAEVEQKAPQVSAERRLRQRDQLCLGPEASALGVQEMTEAAQLGPREHWWTGRSQGQRRERGRVGSRGFGRLSACWGPILQGIEVGFWVTSRIRRPSVQQTVRTVTCQ